MQLIFDERRAIILDHLENKGRVKVASLANMLNVSKETVRRDLTMLENEGKLKRIYSGAIKINFQGKEPPYVQRKVMNEDAKKLIGKRAAKLVESDSTIFLGSGTTVVEVARQLKGKQNITILTNSIPVLVVLMDAFNNGNMTGKIIMLGGEVDLGQQSSSGLLCQENMKRFSVDKAIISVGGLSLTKGLTDYDLTETEISRLSIQAAKQSIILADHSKIAVDAFANISSLEDIDIVISDQKMPTSWGETLETFEINWINCRP